jgi:hypothetical protein
MACLGRHQVGVDRAQLGLAQLVRQQADALAGTTFDSSLRGGPSRPPRSAIRVRTCAK